ncbi:hypothetical protein [Pseudomonas sp. 910_21]|uniref:hypothetical protein n=1 Tax=Pseudomonas sp. 910_21 TaxID=2604460 RepID=UPI004063F835
MNRLMMKLMGFVVMSEAGADGAPAGGAVPAAAPQAAPAPAAAAPAADTTLLGQAAPAADPAAQAAQQTPEQKAEAEAAAQKLADEKAANSAPEAYADFTLPEGYEMDAGTLDAFKGLAKELNIPQASAQKLIDLQTALSTKQAEAYQAAVVAQGQQWAAEIKNDPQLGGENYDKSVASAVKVIQAFGDESLSHLLNESGLGNHPALFKFCHRISAAISEDKFVMPGTQADAPQEMTIVDAFR